MPLDATDLPYQQARLFTRSWNHAEVKQGSNAWPSLQACLAQPVPMAAPAPAMAAAPLPEPSLPLDRLYRGGRTEGGMAEATFPVEAGQPLLRVLLETAGTPRRALLISPSGRLHAFSRPLGGRPGRLRPDAPGEEGTGDEAFPGAVGSTLSVAHPEPGLWRMQLSAQGEDAYFLTAAFPGDRSAPVALAEARGLARGRALPLAAAAAGLTVAVHTVRTTPPVAALKAGAGRTEPSILNRTLVLTWPGGKERDLVFSEAE